MTEDVTEKHFWGQSEARDKFDYYVTGLTAAVFVLVLNDVKPEPVGMSPNSVAVCALCVMLLSLYFGLKRIEAVVDLCGLDYQRLHSRDNVAETKRFLDAEKPGTTGVDPRTGRECTWEELRAFQRNAQNLALVAEAAIREQIPRAEKYYRLRNWSFGIGVILLLVAKIWLGYSQSLSSTSPTG